MDDVSILIRTKNEARWLPITMQALRAQQVQPREILIIDSGSTDGTLETVAGLPRIRVVTIAPEAFTYGRALNLGFREATGRYVSCLSAHAVPVDDDWLSSLLRAIQDPRTAAVYGRQLPQPDAYAPIKRDLLACYGVRGRIQASAADHFFSNANALIRRDLWQRFPFDEHLTYCEDQLWARTVLSGGYQIAYEPRAAVYHSHRESLAGVYRRAYQEACAWRQIDPSRSRSFLDYWREWLQNTAGDLAYVLQTRVGTRWLLFSAGYRLAQTLGRLRAFRDRAVKSAVSQPPGLTVGVGGEEKRAGG